MKFIWMPLITTVLVNGMEYKNMTSKQPVIHNTNNDNRQQNVLNNYHEGNRHIITDDIDYQQDFILSGNKLHRVYDNTLDSPELKNNFAGDSLLIPLLEDNLSAQKSKKCTCLQNFVDEKLLTIHLLILIMNFLELKDFVGIFLLNESFLKKIKEIYKFILQAEPMKGLFTADNVLLLAISHKTFNKLFVHAMKDDLQCHIFYKWVYEQLSSGSTSIAQSPYSLDKVSTRLKIIHEKEMYVAEQSEDGQTESWRKNFPCFICMLGAFVTSVYSAILYWIELRPHGWRHIGGEQAGEWIYEGIWVTPILFMFLQYGSRSVMVILFIISGCFGFLTAKNCLKKSKFKKEIRLTHFRDENYYYNY